MLTDRQTVSHDAVIATPKSGLRLGLQFSDMKLTGVDFLMNASALRQPDRPEYFSIIRQIEAYFSDANIEFEIELQLQGTSFQQRVWQALRNIPVGQRLTYGELAMQLGSSARAVGNACRANPVPVIVPCHRVVAKSGLGGFMGHREGNSINIKRWLLLHEGVLNGD